jgi:multidrug efflux pump
MLVSGMIVGTLFTLFVVPSIYMLIARTRAAEPAAAREEASVPGGLPEPA